MQWRLVSLGSCDELMNFNLSTVSFIQACIDDQTGCCAVGGDSVNKEYSPFLPGLGVWDYLTVSTRCGCLHLCDP